MLALLLLPLRVGAQAPAAKAVAPQNEVVPPAAASTASARNHDGFYLRLGLGIGYMAASRRYQDLRLVTKQYETVEFTIELSGLAQVGAFMLGGTPAKGLVVGGGVWGTSVPSPKLSGEVPEDAEVLSVNIDTDMLSISLIGPFVAWYPDPRRGLHGELGFGYSFATSGDEASAEVVSLSSWDAGGWGFVGGVGYDFWVGSEWSFGVLARVSFVQAGDDQQTFKAWVPALAATATFH